MNTRKGAKERDKRRKSADPQLSSVGERGDGENAAGEQQQEKVGALAGDAAPKKDGRSRLSPQSENIQQGDVKKVHFATVSDDGDLKKPRQIRKYKSGGTLSGDDDIRSNLENDSRSAERGKPNRSGPRKRSYSFSEAGQHTKHPATLNKRWKAGRGGGGNVLPSKFLLGGNIHDPLNLNSLNDAEVAGLVNAVTPECSPLPTPKHRKTEYKIEVLIPPNISDPLNLNEDDSDYESKLVSPMSKKRKLRPRKRAKKKPFPALDKSQLPGPTDEDKSEEADVSELEDEVKPAPATEPVTAPKLEPVPEKTAEASSDITAVTAPVPPPVTTPDPPKITLSPQKPAKQPSPQKSAKQQLPSPQKSTKPAPAPKFAKPAAVVNPGKKNRFVHGNYNQYYGYRNANQAEDGRIRYFKEDWFRSKQVLDIGCNIGHISITVGKKFAPSRLVGVDIDKELVSVAKKNIKHYMNSRPDKSTKYPRSFGKQFGALNPLSLHANGADKIKEFPHNLEFYALNYVPETDQLLETLQPEFDTILCLSTTKWMHLNTGDDGLKRAFKKMYAQLKQGGILVLEAQEFSTYGKRKKLSETHAKNYESIKFRPENFPVYLLGEVGFARCEVIALPNHSSRGFQRPLQVFHKLGGSEAPSTSTTPCSFGLSPHSYNPAFTPFYGKFTPGSAPGSAYTPSEARAGGEGNSSAHHGPQETPSNNPEFLYPGPSHLYSGPTPGGYSANSTPSGMTPGYPGGGNTPHGGYSANSTPSRNTPQYSRNYSYKPTVYTGPSSAFSTPGNALSSPLYGRTSGGRSPQTEEGGVTSTGTPDATPAPVPPSPSPPEPLSNHSEGQTPSYTPRYTPSYTPGTQSEGNTPVYTGPTNSPGPSSPLYSPGNATPAANYSPSQYSPDTVGPGYSPSGPAYSPSAPYSPSSPAYSPSSAGFPMSSPQNYSPHTPSYSPGPQYSPGPAYSPGNATPTVHYSPALVGGEGYSPSIQGAEVSGNTTPHPGASDSPLSTSPGPRYSWSGGNPSGRNTPVAPGSASPAVPSPNPAGMPPSPALPVQNPASPAVNTVSPVYNPASPATIPATLGINKASIASNPASPMYNPTSPAPNPATIAVNKSYVASNPASPVYNPASPATHPVSSVGKMASTTSNPTSPAYNPSSPAPNPVSSAVNKVSTATNPGPSAMNKASIASNPASPVTNLVSSAKKTASITLNQDSPAVNPASQMYNPASPALNPARVNPAPSVSNPASPAANLPSPAYNPASPAPPNPVVNTVSPVSKTTSSSTNPVSPLSNISSKASDRENASSQLTTTDNKNAQNIGETTETASDSTKDESASLKAASVDSPTGNDKPVEKASDSHEKDSGNLTIASDAVQIATSDRQKSGTNPPTESGANPPTESGTNPPTESGANPPTGKNMASSDTSDNPPANNDNDDDDAKQS